MRAHHAGINIPVAVVLLAVTAACTPARPTEKASDARHIRYETTSATWASVDVSPDGRRLIFDLIGHIYELPIAGGTAKPLTSGAAWHRAPRYSPDGSRIAMIRDGDGADEVWVMPAAGGAPTRITDHSPRRYGAARGSPTWSSDGGRIAFGL